MLFFVVFCDFVLLGVTLCYAVYFTLFLGVDADVSGSGGSFETIVVLL